ncbi:MAG: hypothetical protein ABIU05_06240, partial [Nitrospirales bacterium]
MVTQQIDAAKWIAFEQKKVRLFPFLDRSHLILNSDQSRGSGGLGKNRLHRAHSERDHPFKFLGILADAITLMTAAPAALRVQVYGGALHALDADSLRALAGLGNVVSRLHPHKGIHLHAESLFNAK